MKKYAITAVVAVVAALSIFVLGGEYNSLKGVELNVQTQQSQIENQLQRRADLIPNLVASVKGYMQHEERVLTEVTEARTQLMNATSLEAKAAADTALTAALGRLIAVSESYPDLKANTQFIELMREIAGSENRIAVARRDYNNAVQEYNLAAATFPSNIFAKILGFGEIKPFEADASAHEAPKVDL